MATIPTTPARYRASLVPPIPASDDKGYGGELEAIDALWDAYMALNAAGVREPGTTTPDHVGESPLAHQDGPAAPMALVAKGARAALARIPGVGDAGARKIWAEMVENASGARWNYDMWRVGHI